MGNLISAAALRVGPKVFDFCALSSLFAFVYIAMTRAESALSRALERLQTARPHAKLTVVDRLIAAALIVAFCASVYYKLNITEARRGSSSTDYQLLWLLQPCYITQLMLLFVVLFPQSRYNSTVFAVTLAWMWGAVASFVFPDRSGYTQPFELANYYLQHVSICGAPILYLFTRRSAGLAQLSLRENMMVSAFGNCLHCFYHLFLLWPLASATNINLNYMLSPPSGIPSAISQSPHYRFIIMAATFLLAGPATGVLLPRLVHALPPLPFLSYKIATHAASADSKQRDEDGGSDKKQ